MISALGLALLAAIEPLGVVAFIAVLGSRGGRRNTRGFIVGWVVCACVVALATVLASGRSRAGDVSAAISSAGLLQVALGVTALVYLVLRHRRDPARLERSDEAMVKEDNLKPPGAAMIAAALQGWPVVAAAVAAVLKSTDGTIGRLLGVAAVVVVSVSTFVVAHVLAGREPERTAAWLGALRGWIETRRNRVIDILLLGAGSYLIVHGVLAQLAK
ncbi:MAG: GAP family protein [Nocardioidaceae bacterium]